MEEEAPPSRAERYAIFEEIAAGGMASVHFGRLRGAAGFSRLVAIKRLHAQYAKLPEFVAMFVDEARLVSRIRHPNVVPTLDVVADGPEVFLVLEYIPGESLSALRKAAAALDEPVPPAIACAIVAGALRGLHAAHEATDRRGEPLHLIHRDVSPQNILVGVDGVARVLDFGVAKAEGRLYTTRDGGLKGKVGYMAPEQFGTAEPTRLVDVYAAGVVLWETLAGRARFPSRPSEAARMAEILAATYEPLTGHVADVTPRLDEVIRRAVAREASERFATAEAFADALEEAIEIAPHAEVAVWVARVAAATLAARAEAAARVEQVSDSKIAVGTTAGLVSAAGRARGGDNEPTRLAPLGRRRAALVGGVLVGVLLAVTAFVRFSRSDVPATNEAPRAAVTPAAVVAPARPELGLDAAPSTADAPVGSRPEPKEPVDAGPSFDSPRAPDASRRGPVPRPSGPPPVSAPAAAPSSPGGVPSFLPPGRW